MDAQRHPAISLRTYGDGMPSVAEVEGLYAAASQPPPLSEAPDVARLFASLYGYAKKRGDFLGVSALAEGRLAGFAYGHHWTWDAETDAWSQELRRRLGEAASERVGQSFAVALLAVHPSFARRGLGSALLKNLMDASGAAVHWLQTTNAETPAKRLYQRFGFKKLGLGPDAPNGKPGLVLVRDAAQL